jgi:hypothetical protein
VKKKERAAPQDQLLDYEDVALRWKLSEIVAKRRIKEDKIPIVRLNRKTVRVRLSDILKFEARATNQLPIGFTDGAEMRAKRGKAEVGAK